MKWWTISCSTEKPNTNAAMCECCLSKMDMLRVWLRLAFTTEVKNGQGCSRVYKWLADKLHPLWKHSCVSVLLFSKPPPTGVRTWFEHVYANKKNTIIDDAPVVEGTWPEQQPTRNRNQVLFFGLGEASTEVEGQDDEEWNIPGMAKEAAVIDRPWIKLVKM